MEEFFAEQSGKAERYDELERNCTDRIELSPNAGCWDLNWCWGYRSLSGIGPRLKESYEDY